LPGCPLRSRPDQSPDPSLLHLRPPASPRPRPNRPGPGCDNQPVKVRRFLSARAKENRPVKGGQRSASNAFAPQLRSSQTIYKATPSGHCSRSIKRAPAFADGGRVWHFHAAVSSNFVGDFRPRLGAIVEPA
jgi:hypothetical protein